MEKRAQHDTDVFQGLGSILCMCLPSLSVRAHHIPPSSQRKLCVLGRGWVLLGYSHSGRFRRLSPPDLRNRAARGVTAFDIPFNFHTEEFAGVGRRPHPFDRLTMGTVLGYGRSHDGSHRVECRKDDAGWFVYPSPAVGIQLELVTSNRTRKTPSTRIP